MSHYYTSCANLTIGLLRPTAPELVHDSDSEGGTPLVTPIHTNFGNISNYMGDTAGTLADLVGLTCGRYNHTGKRSLEEGEHDYPVAPRLDNGSFDCDLVCEHEPSPGLDTYSDSSVNYFKGDYSCGFNKVPAHLSQSCGPEVSEFSSAEVRRAETVLAYGDPTALEDRYGTWTIPRAPRPDTGSWSSSTEAAASVVHWNWNWEKKQAFWYRPQPHGVTRSVSAKSTPSKHVAPNGQVKTAEQLTPEYAPTRIMRWDLGLGLTLDDIAEPGGCGASVGELSMEFAEDSFFDLDTDSGYCSTADTTLNTTIETIPDLVRPCPNSPVGSATHASSSGPELGITPQLRMLSLQGHHENVNRQRTQNSAPSGPGTRFAYAPGFPSETDVACVVGRLRTGELGGFCGLANGAAWEFVAGEQPLKEAQGRSEDQMADAPIFTLLPPIEL